MFIAFLPWRLAAGFLLLLLTSTQVSISDLRINGIWKDHRVGDKAKRNIP
jgi:hypothetical protein